MSREWDFSVEVQRTAFKNAGGMCAVCWAATAGPSSNPSKPSNMGECGHIHSGSKIGPRYIDGLRIEAIKSIENAIWLCRNHHADVDGDDSKYTVEELLRLRAIVEGRAKAKQGIPQNPEIVGTPKPSVTISVGRDNLGQISAGDIHNYAPPRRTLVGTIVDPEVLAKIKAGRVDPVDVESWTDLDSELLRDELRGILPGFFGIPVKPGISTMFVTTAMSYGVFVRTKADAANTEDPLALFAAVLRSAGIESQLVCGAPRNAVSIWPLSR